jgi:catechol 2,3-dioxygenase-like lactoylglutathione lyase family enzyme
MTDHNETVSVRSMVDDVAAALAFYTTILGFEVLTSFPPAFADVARGRLRLLLSGPASSAGRPMPDGARPGPGGWNRILIELFQPAAAFKPPR